MIFLCLKLSIMYNTANIYYDIVVSLYGAVKREVQLAIFERVVRGVEGPVMLLLTPLVVAGFVKISC